MSEEVAQAAASLRHAAQITVLHRILANSDRHVRELLATIAQLTAACDHALAQLEAAAARNVILQRLLGLETIDGLGADLLADYHRLKRIVAIADGYVRFGGTDRWQALRDALEEGVDVAIERKI